MECANRVRVFTAAPSSDMTETERAFSYFKTIFNWNVSYGRLGWFDLD